MYRHNIVLVGFMGTGKSTIGRLLAANLGFQLVDVDGVIVERAGMEIAEIFATAGEARFREQETSAIESLSLLRRCVIATGGGAVVSERNRRLLRELGFVVQLTAREEVIFERVSRNSRRPLLQTADPRATVSAMLAARADFYTAAAHCTIDTSHLSHPQAAEAVIAEARLAFGWIEGREANVGS